MTTLSFVLGIAGGTGAGKTTIAHEVADGFNQPTTLFALDNYYEDHPERSFAERKSINYDHPTAFDWELIRAHVEKLCSGEPVEMPQYDFETHARTGECVPVEPTDVLVIEGIFALYDEKVSERLDLGLYVETDADVRIIRRIRRDVLERGRSLDGVIEQYLGTVKPMHEQFVAPTKKQADLVVPEGANSAAVDLLGAAIAEARNSSEPNAPLIE